MEQHHRSHIAVIHHPTDQFIDGPISISSIVHQLSRINQHQLSDADSVLCSIDHHSTNVSDSECTIDSNVHSISNGQSISHGAMAAEHQWRIVMEQHHRSHIDVVHHSIDNIIDGPISISSIVRQRSWFSDFELSDADSILASCHRTTATITNRSKWHCGHIRGSSDFDTLRCRTMATECRWRPIVEYYYGSYLDLLLRHSKCST